MRASNFYLGFGLVTLSGCLWFLACTPFDLSALAWIAAVPMLLAIDRAPTLGRALFLGWWAGVVETAGGFYWLIEVMQRFAGFPVDRGGAGVSAVLRRPRADLPALYRRGLRHSPAAAVADDRARADGHGRLRIPGAAIVSLRPVDQPGLAPARHPDQRTHRAARGDRAADDGQWRALRCVARIRAARACR